MVINKGEKTMRVEHEGKKYAKFGQQWYECQEHDVGVVSHMRVPMNMNAFLTKEFPEPRKKKVTSKPVTSEVKAESKSEEEVVKRRTKKSGKKLSKAAFRSLLTKK
jgi:hypothetical protein